MAPKPVDVAGFMQAAEGMMAKLDASSLVSKKELESIRSDLVKQIKAEAKATTSKLGTMQIGTSKVLVPNSPNLRALNLSTERIRKKTTSFKLTWLDKRAAKKLRADGTLSGTKPGEFIRHSRRLVRHAKEFLTLVGELEPDLQEEIDAALTQLRDNELDIIKLDTKSWTNMKETMLRGVNGRKKRSAVLKEIDSFDINRSLWNLSLLEHPKATVQQLLAQASERMAEKVTTTISEIPKRAHVMVGIPSAAAEKMTPESRTSKIAWRLFSVKEIDKKYEGLKQVSPTSWKGLGLSYNTPEWYIPVPPHLVDDLKPVLKSKRSALLQASEERGAEEAAKKAARAKKLAGSKAAKVKAKAKARAAKKKKKK